jgi:lipopolysaccharide/colanic/teichoic acid biosynthesis glycosyltransferase
MKRLFDLSVAIVALILLSPLIAVVALAVRINMGSPLLFRQARPGWHGKPFTLLKFRTMRDGADGSGQMLPDDERLTPFGRFLRRTSFDELPELINVLKGEMSLVGPRPLLLEYVPLYSAEQARRHEVRPGITGLAQVSGRNAISWEERLRLDAWYVDHRSFALDLRILWQTVVNVLAARGISEPGQATMQRFRGTRS